VKEFGGGRGENSRGLIANKKYFNLSLRTKSNNMGGQEKTSGEEVR